MHVCNISFQLIPTVENAWLVWMKTTLIPEIMACQCFVDQKLYQLEIPIDQNPTYTLQLFAHSGDQILNYQTHYADKILLQLKERWGEECLYFTTQMQIVH